MTSPELLATKETPRAVAPPLLLNPLMPKRYVPHTVRLTVVGQFNVEEPVTVSRKLADAVWCVGVVESVTSRVNWKVPVAVGVPEIVALGEPEASMRPAGRLEPVARLQV